jgi:hypothetical protein
MSKTLNRPMFKRGPDGQMRQAKFIGGILRAAPQVYRAAKYYAPKFSNIPYNINRMVNPRAAGIQNPVVGKTGPMNQIPFKKGKPTADVYDFRLQEWSGKLNNLRNKHNLTALEASGVKGIKGLPQEVIDHWKAIPKMPGGRKITEQLAYPFTYSMLDNWTTDHSEAASNVDVEAGSTVETETEQKPSDRQPGLFGSENDIEGPITPGSNNVPDDSVADLDSNDEYDGEPSDRQPGLFGSEMPDLASEAIAADETISAKSIEDYKAELQGIMGKEDGTMGPLMLMQLGLGMMAGKSNQPGFAGFAEILGKTGQQVLPMWMQHMQNKRKEDKEISLAAYEMLREDRAAKRKRADDLTDWVWKEQYKLDDWVQKENYKNAMNPPGDLSMIQMNTPFIGPNGEMIDNWTNVKQVFSKSPEALKYIALGDPNIQVVPFNMTDAGAKASGLGDMNLTKAQRGEQSLLAGVYKSNLEQILNFVTDPEIGVHSGNFQTGTAGLALKTARFVTKDVQNFFNTFFPNNKTASNAMSGMYGMMRSQTEDTMQSLVNSQMGLLAGEGNIATENHGGQKDVQFGKYDDGSGNIREGNFATEKYVRNLMDNQFYDVEEQMINMMGFLEARLKQPTGRLLADTIQTSINNLKKDRMLTSGDPRQYANKMHMFVKRLYNAYATHAMRAGMKPETQFGVGRLNQPLTIQGYNESYLGFVGPEAIDQGINLGFLGQFPDENQTLSTGNNSIYSGTNEVNVTGPADFGELMELYK